LAASKHRLFHIFHDSDKSEGEVGGANTFPNIFDVIGKFADGSTFPALTAFEFCHTLMDVFPKLDEFISVFFTRHISWLFIDLSQDTNVTIRDESVEVRLKLAKGLSDFKLLEFPVIF
jgi:hypothetical protein